jgi:uncharacterized protein YggE
VEVVSMCRVFLWLLGCAVVASGAEECKYKPPEPPEYIIDWQAGTIATRVTGSATVEPDVAFALVDISATSEESREKAAQEAAAVGGQLKAALVAAGYAEGDVFEYAGPEERADTGGFSMSYSLGGGLGGGGLGQRRDREGVSAQRRVLVQVRAPEEQALSREDIAALDERVTAAVTGLPGAEVRGGGFRGDRVGGQGGMRAVLPSGAEIRGALWLGARSVDRDALLRAALQNVRQAAADKAAKMAAMLDSEAGEVLRMELYRVSTPSATGRGSLGKLPDGVQPAAVVVQGATGTRSAAQAYVTAEVTCALKRK